MYMLYTSDISIPSKEICVLHNQDLEGEIGEKQKIKIQKLYDITSSDIYTI